MFLRERQRRAAMPRKSDPNHATADEIFMAPASQDKRKRKGGPAATPTTKKRRTMAATNTTSSTKSKVGANQPLAVRLECLQLYMDWKAGGSKKGESPAMEMQRKYGCGPGLQEAMAISDFRFK